LLSAILKKGVLMVTLGFFVPNAHCSSEICHTHQVFLIFPHLRKCPIVSIVSVQPAGTYGNVFVVYSGSSNSFRANWELFIEGFDEPVLFRYA
jgi:hypothetical protein